MKTLYCGPYIGELGWNLCWYNPLARYCAQEYDYIIAAADHKTKYLWEFADEFIELDCIGQSYYNGKLFSKKPIIQADKILDPQKEFAKYPNEPDRISTPRKWRLLAPPQSIYVADILCAFRPQKRIEQQTIPGKEYPIEKCQRIVDLIKSQGLSVACYGGFDNHCPSGAIDLRGQPLEGQCSAIAAAKCVVGPSSGPIHLASLCGCPHVTWIASAHYTLKQRYTKLWNPFNTPVRFICHSRLPSPEEVMKHVEVILKEGVSND